MFGIDLHAPTAFMEIGLILVLFVWVMADSHHDYKVRKAALLTPIQVNAIIRKMQENQTNQELFREAYSGFLRQGRKTPLFILETAAMVTDMKHHVLNDNHYFYHPTSGFMTVIPAHHVH
jgi:hypothetical protein